LLFTDVGYLLTLVKLYEVVFDFIGLEIISCYF
jgi:hypothetical protein